MFKAPSARPFKARRQALGWPQPALKSPILRWLTARGVVKIAGLVLGTVLVAGLGAVAGVAVAATAPAWDEAHYNPQPSAGDVMLPMPCGGQMAFRKVLIPLTEPLDDFAVTLGSTDQAWGFLESAQQDHIAGSFTETGNDRGRYYLMGKYEITRLQYEALMTETCAKPSIHLRVPQTAISWFDAVEFANRYTQWLQAQAPQALPLEDAMSGFVRLPTEVEWSFAARGGLAATPSAFQDRVFPMSGPMSQYVWFAGPQSSNGRMRPAGLLAPNPLGLHDILGNADEMMFEPFRLRTHGRSHGQAGGFVVRGGNYLTPAADIRTAWRVEQPYYREGKPNTLPSTGFRVVVVAPAITSTERLKVLEQQWLALGTDPVQAPIAAPDTTEQLALLAAQAQTAADKQALNQVRDELRAANQRQREQRERAIRSSLQLGGFFCAQLNQLSREIERRQDFLALSCDPQNPRSGQQTCDNIRAVTAQTEASLNTMLQLYSDTIVEVGSIYPAQAIVAQSKVTIQALQSQQSLNLKPFVEGYVDDLVSYIEDRRVRRQRWLETCRTIVQ